MTLVDFLGGNLAQPIEAIGNVLDKLTTSDDERNAFTLAMAKLKDHQEELKTEFSKLQYQGEISDRASAREMEIATRDKMPMILSVLVTIGFFGLIIILTLDDGISSSYKDTLQVMTGSLGASFLSIVSYYFGGSPR